MAHLQAVPQTNIYETTIEDADLEALLEERQKAKEQAGSIRKVYKKKDDAAKAKIEEIELGDGAAVRVGRFVVSRRPVAARDVEFHTAPTTRISIRPLP